MEKLRGQREKLRVVPITKASVIWPNIDSIFSESILCKSISRDFLTSIATFIEVKKIEIGKTYFGKLIFDMIRAYMVSSKLSVPSTVQVLQKLFHCEVGKFKPAPIHR